MKARTDYTRIDDITLDEVKAVPIFKDFSDEQALEVIQTIKEFTLIVYEYYQKNRQKPFSRQ